MNTSVIIRKISNNLVDSIIPDAESVTARVSSGSGNIRITLKDIKDRDYTQMEVAERISQAIRNKTKARAFVQQTVFFRRTERKYARTICTTKLSV